MRQAGQQGSLVTLICDSGERYVGTYYNAQWLRSKGIDTAPFEHRIEQFLSGENFACDLAVAD
jgi:cysteine synthase A